MNNKNKNKKYSDNSLDHYSLDLLSNTTKMVNEKLKEKKDTTKLLISDDNEEIMKLLNERLNLGRKRYGHGVIVNDDTRKYGTIDNDWELMALEELLDGLIYTTAAIIRHRRNKKSKKKYNDQVVNDDIVVKYH